MIGQRFGNYRALSLLGEGGMGAVYLAEHPDIGRRVAVKVLRPELIQDPQLLLRFLNEARAANAIRHPNIIEILDSGTTPDATPYLVMELLEGEVLSERIRRLGKLPLGDVLEFSYQAASALAAAHDKSIIHRDLKPDNLFIIRDPSDATRERIKVLDFGIAKLQAFPTGGGMQTRTGTLMGTPVYMSPEQCLGTKTIDSRSDIYAMGVIMYEMICGRPPFLSEGFGELVNMHLNVRPRPLHEIDPHLPAAVWALVAKALEKSPEQRQRSASELQLEIRAAAGQSIPIRGTSSIGLAPTTLSTPPGGAGAAGRGVAPHAFAGVTTLSTGTGERKATLTMPAARGSGVRRVVIGVVAAAGLAIAVMAGLRQGGDAEQATLSPTAAVGEAQPEQTLPDPLIRLTIDSRPAGATVTDVTSGRPLGVTPIAIERRSAEGPVNARLEKAGFEPVTRAFALDRDRSELVQLVPSAAAAATAAPSGVERTPAKATASGKNPTSGRPPKSTSRARHSRDPYQRADDEPAKL